MQRTICRAGFGSLFGLLALLAGHDLALAAEPYCAGMPAVLTGAAAAPADLKKTIDDLKNLFKKKQ